MSSYIKALVLQKNNTVFVREVGAKHIGATGSQSIISNGIGSTGEIPCPGSNGGVIDGDYWAKPVNEGVAAAGFTYEPYSVDDDAVAPDAQSFAVVRISSVNSADVWWVIGTSEDYIASCDACCDNEDPTLMPTISSIPLQAGCQTLCTQDADGNFNGNVGVPSFVSPQRLFPAAYLNGVAVTPAPIASGYTSVSSLLAFLNASWSALGVWTKSVDNLTIILTQQPGPGTDILCMDIFVITPSV